MNLKAIIASVFVLGSSSLALASPRPIVRDHRTEVAFNEGYVRDHRSNLPPIKYPTPTPAPTPAPSYDGYRTIETFHRAFDGLKTIDFGCEGQYVNSLRIFSADQNSEVQRVVVHKMDGTSYDYFWNHIFATANDGQQGPYLGMVPLTQVRSIDIYARNASNSTFAVQIKA